MSNAAMIFSDERNRLHVVLTDDREIILLP